MTLRPWTDLRAFTPARVALGRVGHAVPTAAHLSFQADHAAARDAVHATLDIPALQAALGRDVPVVRSQAADRATYLLRPDLGRKLHPDQDLQTAPNGLVIVIADGLSAIAVQHHAAPFIASLGHTGPIVVALQARVAIGDEIGAALQAAAVLVLIGERPGLSSADGMSAYLTFQPRPGRTDAERNCVSNIRSGGLAIADAARKVGWLIGEMRRLRLTGIGLKDDEPVALGYDNSISVVST